MPFFEHGTTKLYYQIHGKGQPLLMIAGMSSDSNSWQYILDRMKAGHMLICFDNRGCGRTSYHGAFSLQDLAGDAAALLQHLSIEQADLVGHSMGGMIAQQMAIDHPEMIDRLILACTSPKLSARATAILDDLLMMWKDGADMSEWFRKMFLSLFTEEANANKKFIDAAIIFALAYPYPQSLGGFEHQVRAIKAFDSKEKLHLIKQKTLILTGENDRLFRAGDTHLLDGISGEKTHTVIEGAAHSVHAEKPGPFVREVKKFLES